MNFPSIPFENRDSLTGAFKAILDKNAKTTDGKLPAKVIKYDRATNRVTVQPLIRLITTDGTAIERPVIASLPVYQIGGGGFILSFNLTEGDLGWIDASDRDISLFLKSYAIASPNTHRVKSFSDAVFYPDVMTGYTIAEEDAANAVLQSNDGTVKVALSSTGVKILASASITIEAPSIIINGDVTSTGTFTNNGTNISSTHTHPDPQGGSTGTPQ